MNLIADGEILEVGDVVIIKTGLRKLKLKVARVTKTLAFLDGPNIKNHSVKRVVSHCMTHPYQRWDTQDYKCFRDFKKPT